MAGSLLYYATYKYVLLKDARLGVLYYTLAVLTLLFTMVEIFVKKGYMEFDTRPQGSVNLILSDEFSADNRSPGNFSYCAGDLPCVYLDPWDLNWPDEARAVTVTTLRKDRIQVIREASGPGDDPYQTQQEKVYFTQGPEYVVIKVDHAVVASQFTDVQGSETVAASHRQLRGYLVDVNGNRLRELSAPALGKPDRVTVDELLQAAGVSSLEGQSDTVNAKGRSFRERGLILRVTIFYQNWFSTWIGTSDIEYTYHVRRVPFVDYSSKQVWPLLSKEEVISQVGDHSPHRRLVKKRYSIRVEFQQAGSLGQFSLPTLLFKLVSGMGLLTLTATVVDTLALYLLPDKRLYRQWLYEEVANTRTTSTNSNNDDNSKEKSE